MRGALLSGVLISTATLVASCRPAGVLDPQGPIAAAERLLLINSTAIMLVVVIPVILATLAFAWRYRASNPRASRSPDSSYEGRIEFVTWSIPALTVILLGGVIWIGTHQLDPRAPIPAKTDPLRLDVVALDWKWLFIYPDQGIAAVNQLVIPAGTPVQFRLTSATVMNSFFVPQLGSQIYTMSGMTTHLHLLADAPGQFPGFSANFSGAGFPQMRFVVEAVPAGDFTVWVAQAQGTGAALDEAGYAELAKPSTAVPASVYRSVAPRLFERIVDQTASDPARADVGAASHDAARHGGG
jgi:cytochrome o ubiquinol oxidase subunit II